MSTYRLFDVRVAALERLTPHFVRVTFESDQLADLGWDGPDQRIKLLFPIAGQNAVAAPQGDDWYSAWRALPDAERPPMRTYTTRYARPQHRQLVVDFVAHGDTGPATRWVNRARIGDGLLIVAPDGAAAGDSGGHEWHPGEATSFLIAGDESAVPAVGAILESMPANASGVAFLEVPTAEDALKLAIPSGVRVAWLARGSSPHGALLDRAVREWASSWRPAPVAADEDVEPDPDDLWEVPDAPDGAGLYAWLAGEAGVITGLRRHLVREVGIDRKRIAFMGYWKAGRAESD